MLLLDFKALAPIAVLGITGTLVMLWIGLSRRKAGAPQLSIAGMALALMLVPMSAGQAPRDVTMLMHVDGFAVYFMALLSFAALAVGLLSLPYFKLREAAADEFYVLLPIAAAGALAMVCAKHFASFYLGLEVLSISLYAMIAYIRNSRAGTEAAVKYLVLAGAAAAFLLFGMALVYAELGTLSLPDLAQATLAQAANGVLLLGFAMVLIGIGFKLSIVPFHLWTADVYQGAPAPVSAFLATVSKAAVFAFMLRYFAAPGSDIFLTLFNAFSLAAVASMFAGNLLALRQHNVKRLLAYSSIAHVGYLAMAFLAGGDRALEAGSAYLTAYVLTSLGTFGVITLRSAERPGRDADDWEDYRGLIYTSPCLGGVFVLMLFSLAGLPLTAGFIGKFFLVKAGFGAGSWILLLALIVNSALGLYYYLRLALAVCTPAHGPVPSKVPTSWAGVTVLASVCIGTLWMGVFPTGIVNAIHHFVLAAK